MKKISTLLMCLLVAVTQLLAQNKTVTGKVVDEKGAAVAGASVVVKGSTKGTTTGSDGSFSISVPETAKALVISSVNFTTQEIAIKGSSVSITLQSTTSSLDEVVVVGYGTQKKKDVISSIATIKGDNIKDIPVQSFDQALSGKAVGVNVSLPNGVLNNPPVIRVRGANSISGNTQPLIVIDGVPTFQGDYSTNSSANNALGSLNPSDIDDIQILKDAAASAIYGSRAANGVMLITTKKGKLGKAKVQYDFSIGFTKPFNIFEVLNAEQYVTLKNEGLRNLNQVVVTGQSAGSPLFFLDTINGKQVNTKWADEVYQNGKSQTHNLSISGANESTKYYFSANYTKQDGILQTNTFDRRQIRMNIETKATEWLKFGGNFNYSRGSTFSPSTGSLPGSAFNTAGSARLAFVTAPNVSPFAADGRYNIIGIDNPTQRNNFNQIGRNRNLFNSGFVNPVMIRDLNIISSQIDQISANISGELKLAKGLTFRSQYGINYQLVDDRTFWNPLHGDGIQTTSTADDGSAFNVFGKYNITNFQNVLTYDFKLGIDHNFNVLVGHEEQSSKTDRYGAKRSGLFDNFNNEYQGNFTVNDNPVNNSITENYLLSYFGRLSYNYKGKYSLSANIRRDGYSAFSDEGKYGTFAGGGIGWTISEEKFWGGIASKVFSNFKLRASYGQVGSISSVGNFGSLSLFSPFQYGLGYPTLSFSQAGNKNLKWENSKKLDLGVNFGILKNKINVEFTYYNTDLSDLIINVPQAPSLGIPGNTVQLNAGAAYNRGIEFNINASIIDKKDFSWNVSFNLATQENKVTALADGVPEIVGITGLERTNITRPGISLGSFFLAKTNGVDAATGRRIFVNAANTEVLFDFSNPTAAQRWRYRDGTVAPAIDLGRDGYVAGNSLPKVYGGFTNTFRFKDIDFSFDMYYSFGNAVYFGSRAGLLDQRFWNNSTIALNRWQKAGDVTNVPRVVFNDNISNGSSFPIDANLYNGDFIKMRNVSLGYNIPKELLRKIKISGLRLYAQAFNLFTITNYPGADPEISSNGAEALTPGVDRNTIGQARSFNLGLNVTF
ncbi:MAG: SusC/RagA family TonB-linked outer membrane protein [Flavobacterium sp.]|nr:SusC/RagA family TonB-linked outer membrane protein [Flavobacterium sp.]